MTIDLNLFLVALGSARSVRSVEQTMQNFIEAIGFEVFAYVAISMPSAKLTQPVSSFTYPMSWIDHYRERQFAVIDPTFAKSTRELLPFLWDGIITDHRSSNRQKAIYLEAGEFGLKQGLTIPIHAAGPERALLSVASSVSVREFVTRFQAARAELLFAAYAYHNEMRKRLSNQTRRVALGARETEVLSWAAKGKTSWETGEILRVSENTVNFHLKSAIRKLGVSNKRQAVVHAIMLGLILPDITAKSPL